MANISKNINQTLVNITVDPEWIDGVRIPALVTDREGAILKEALKDPVASKVTTDSDDLNKKIEELKALKEKAAEANEAAKGFVQIDVELNDDLTAFIVKKDGRVRNENVDADEVATALKDLKFIYSKTNLFRILVIAKSSAKTPELRAEKLESEINIGMKKGDIRKIVSVTSDGEGGYIVGYISKAAVRKIRGYDIGECCDDECEDDEY